LAKPTQKRLRLMRDASKSTFMQDPESATVPEAPLAAIAAGAASAEHGLDDVAAAILKVCSQS